MKWLIITLTQCATMWYAMISPMVCWNNSYPYQEVAYNSLLQKRKTEIHEKIGTAIEALYAESLEEFYEVLAYHYTKSDNSEKANQYLKLSGNKTSKNYSNSEALRT